MQLMIAAAPELRQTACAARLPVANAAYRLEGGYLCALPMPRSLQGGALLLTGWDGVWRDTAAQGILRECRARQYGAVIVPFPDPSLVQALAPPLYRAGLALWVHENCAHAAPGGRVLVCTALSGGDMEERLTRCCRAFGADRIVLDLQRLRMDFRLPARSGQGKPLSGEALDQLMAREAPAVFFSQDLCARYFTYTEKGETHFVLFDDADTLNQKVKTGAKMGFAAAFFMWPEVRDIAGKLGLR